jgi:hypothetical protein
MGASGFWVHSGILPTEKARRPSWSFSKFFQPLIAKNTNGAPFLAIFQRHLAEATWPRLYPFERQSRKIKRPRFRRPESGAASPGF